MQLELAGWTTAQFDTRRQDCNAQGRLDIPTTITLSKIGRRRATIECPYLTTIPNEQAPIGKEGEGLCVAPDSVQACLDYAEQLTNQSFSITGSYREITLKYPVCPVRKTGRIPK